MKSPIRAAILASAGLAPAMLFGRLQTQPVFAALCHEWFAAADLPPSCDLLDLGCGPGLMAKALSAQGHRVVAADRSSRMIRAARANCGPEIDVVIADASRLPFGDDRFDAVLAASLLNVVADPVNVLKEAARVTRAGGLVSCLVPTGAFTPDCASNLAREFRLGWLDRAILETWASISRKLDQFAVKGYFEAAGLNGVVTAHIADRAFLATFGRV